MKTSDIKDPMFKAAVEAIDGGDVPELNRLVDEHPTLVSERLLNGEQGYFKDPTCCISSPTIRSAWSGCPSTSSR